MSFSSSSVRLFSLDEIKEATNNFDQSNLITGDYDGDVYRAKVYDAKSKTEKVSVAVKRLRSNFSSHDFENEVYIATTIQHPNLISLLGYCVESDEKALVYENIDKGSLNDYVKKDSTVCLSWKQRLNICLGAAYGLQHLHRETLPFPYGIIHRNVKPSNICLDENWVVKVSGFAMSYVDRADSYIENVAGTSGYIAPEYVRFRLLSRNVDVYGFGVVLFQVLCRKSPWDRDDSDDEVGFSLEEDFGIRACENADNKIAAGILDDSLKAFTDTIGKCLQVDPDRRPTMDQVVLDIETAIKFQGLECEPVLTIDLKAPRKLWQMGGVTQSASSSSSYNLSSYLLSCSCPQFSFAEINEATHNFSESKVLGHGLEATVYLAEIHLNSKVEKTQVAVKRLNGNSNEFVKEILTLTEIQHPNIVSLLGYCNDSDEKILIYEYMGKGSLSGYVKMDSAICLSWKQRLNICLGVAYGLQHLHKETDESPKGIIHRDVKPANILLDQNWVAKVSDFGMFKPSEPTQTKSTIITNHVVGTNGYFAPEYLNNKQLSRKIDVYAFGMVMFDVLCRKSFWDHGDVSYYLEEEDDVAVWAKDSVDIKIKDKIAPISLTLFTDVIAATVQKDPHKRPTMDVVVQKLETALRFQESYESYRNRG